MQEGGKDEAGKLNYSLVPMEVLEVVIRVFEKGTVTNTFVQP